MSVGKKIRNIRVSLGLSQSELARRIGKKPHYINQVENDTFKPSLRTLNDIARGLNTRPGILLEDTSETLKKPISPEDEQYLNKLLVILNSASPVCVEVAKRFLDLLAYKVLSGEVTQDKRHAERLPCAMECQFRFEDRPEQDHSTSRILNISQTGFCIESPGDITITDDRIRIFVNSFNMTVKGRIAWFRRLGKSFSFGIELEDPLSPNVLATLKSA